MSHVRQQIRDAVVAALGTIPDFALVEASRVYTAQQSPACIVYTGTEEAQQDTIGRAQAWSYRRLTATVEIYSKAGSGAFDDEIDALCVQVEKQLVNDPTFFPMAQTWEYTGLNVEYSKDADRAGGVATLEYVFSYRVQQDDPEIGV